MSNKDFRLKADDIKKLIDSNLDCLATDRITVDGCKVGFIYRDNPVGKYPDSGWCFFAGDESDEYANDPSNSGVYHLNTICNYDPDIIPFLDSDYGTAYYRDKEGNFLIDKKWKPSE